MKKFRFFSSGIAPTSRKNYLSPACKQLQNLFTVADIKPGMFSDSITKKLVHAKKHGTKIILRKWRSVEIGVVVVDKEDQKKDLDKRKKLIKQIKKKLKSLSASSDIVSYLKYLSQLGKVSGNNYLQQACACIFIIKQKWRLG